ncbi:MAG TPA: ribosome biogenesis GTP-binding protein YihA/YsxC [Rhodanobacteraceae bacterium]|nr:ribosome biogenesis GTP-binding protein YihA/YsxC [Rhodanobacteraceae bacterium]
MTPAPTSQVSAKRAANPLREARFLRSAAQLAQLPADNAPEVAFVGRSNAGKSSALNRVCDQGALARVSGTPGRTQLINLFALPGGARLADLPGYGYAKAPPEARRNWEALVGHYVAQRANLRGLVVLMDVRRPLQPLDVQMLDWARAYARPTHILLTKADKLSRGAAAQALAKVRSTLAVAREDGISVQLFSSHDGCGIDAARHAVLEWLHTEENATV